MPGELLAIMGSSGFFLSLDVFSFLLLYVWCAGSGKTTMLSALAGRLMPGQRLIAGICFVNLSLVGGNTNPNEQEVCL